MSLTKSSIVNTLLPKFIKLNDLYGRYNHLIDLLDLARLTSFDRKTYEMNLEVCTGEINTLIRKIEDYIQEVVLTKQGS